ncbi:MAG: hypothetical protein ABI068_04955 [Ktedonobacterales bacterium]
MGSSTPKYKPSRRPDYDQALKKLNLWEESSLKEALVGALLALGLLLGGR